MKIGITGQPGFVGTHLYNYFGLQPEVERIPFKDEYFESEETLQNFVKQCDVIVHLAAMNRHNDPQVLYETNIRLVRQLLMPANPQIQNRTFCFHHLRRKIGIICTENRSMKDERCLKIGQCETMHALRVL